MAVPPPVVSRYDIALGNVEKSLNDPDLPSDARRTGSLFEWIQGYVEQNTRTVTRSRYPVACENPAKIHE